MPHFFLFSFILDIALAVRWAASFGSIRFRGVILSKWRFVAGCAWCSLCCCEWLICGELCQNPTILNSKPPEIASHNRSEKIEANNAIYKDLMSMFDDAKRIFNDTPELKNEFTFPNMLSKVRGNKPAGIIGKVTEADKKTVIEKVTITIKGTDKVASSNDKGRYEITPITASKYTVIAEAEGFEPAVSEEVTIKSGIMSRVNFIMVPKELLKSVA